jgi:hypothetical protein
MGIILMAKVSATHCERNFRQDEASIGFFEERRRLGYAHCIYNTTSTVRYVSEGEELTLNSGFGEQGRAA